MHNELREQRHSPWVAFAMCSAAMYLTTLDLSVVNVAFPNILNDFGISRADASWIVTIYNIFFASLLVVAGKTADSIGRRRMFRIGVALFSIGSLGAAIAPSLGPLIVARAVQGAGGAILTPATLGLLIAAFPLERRTQVVAMWGGAGALGVASGPSLGALVISLSDWRAAFWINLPLCAILLAISGRFLSESPRSPSEQRPDYGGASLITLALAALALGISQSEVWGPTDVRTLGCIAGGLAVVAAFVRRQKTHPEPIVDLALFESRSFTIANFSGLAFFAGFAAMGLNNVLFLREAWGYDILTAGLLTAAAPVVVAICAPFSGRLAHRHGFRPFVVMGPLIIAGFMVLFTALFESERQPVLFLILYSILAIGVGAFIPVNTAAAMAELPADRLSVGGAVNNTFRQVGSVLGIAALVAVLGDPTGHEELVDSFHRGWYLIAGTMVLAGLTGLRQRRGNSWRPIL
ncbi:MAG: MFS transporter [Acidimicrobiales bacterium]|nr:MFS transporter [Acidimicrobiales bacterium]MDG2219009.1 MFS transporter [Acidimicrobiales bacterium]